MSLGEIVLLLLVGIVVVGPRNLPTMMRTAGQWVARLRRMSTELRTQSGIDDLLRREGLDEHLHQLRSLTRLNVVDTLMTPGGAAVAAPDYDPPAYPPGEAPPLPDVPPLIAPTNAWKRQDPVREREYPLVGCDAGGALPDDAPPTGSPLADAPEPAATEPAATEPAPATPTTPTPTDEVPT